MAFLWRFLREKNPKIEHPYIESTPFHFAAWHGFGEILTFMIDKINMASIDWTDRKNPHSVAMENGQFYSAEIIQDWKFFHDDQLKRYQPVRVLRRLFERKLNVDSYEN